MHGRLGGYVSYGRNRLPFGLEYDGEIFEALSRAGISGTWPGAPAVQGGTQATRGQLVDRVLIWSLADNQRAIDFYRRLGGKEIRRASEMFAGFRPGRVAFGFDADA